MKDINQGERIQKIDQFQEGYEWPEKRRLLATLSYINEDGSLEEITKKECSGAYVVLFDNWDKKYGAHDSSMKSVVKVSELDMACALLLDEAMSGVCDMIVAETAKKNLRNLLKGDILK